MTGPVRTVLLLAAMLAATPALAASPDGLWARGDGRAKVKIAPCGEKLCAVNTWVNDPSGEEKVGDRLVMDVKPTADNRLDGRAFDPQRDRSYRIIITVAERTMSTEGCVLGGLLCKSIEWTRLD
ncbi:DUF2147 domain-containing protein [Methylobrevis pamukkalensis]|uniref:DUF2147 domain-containing protein n=1 Tax=Methylobrevis pamukkalensis TaxID=1439726 RepID=A0A1E3H720_9HYPH|nr:DUF2147 domain-containing protein [Methylobrevis pamukkalensis]ODN71945.1 hypothetical protein A6302_00677 [Methylobrevis pamukkalensis]